jgi:hypothetical protein
MNGHTWPPLLHSILFTFCKERIRSTLSLFIARCHCLKYTGHLVANRDGRCEVLFLLSYYIVTEQCITRQRLGKHRLKAGIMDTGWTFITEQRLVKHVLVAANSNERVVAR